MTRVRMAAVLPILAPLLLAVAAAGAPVAEPDRITLRIEVFGIAGLHLITNRTSFEERGDQYAITTDIETRGVAGVFVDLKSQSVVHGRLAADRAQPQAFRSDVQRNGAERHNRVDYAGDGTVTATSTPSETALRTPVTAAQMRGTVDQLSAYFMLERQLARQGGCNLVVAVFDGRRRYDLHFFDAGEENLPASRFPGPTTVCRMTRQNVAGFTADAEHEEGAQEGRIWFARLMMGDLMVPVQLEFSTQFGLVTGYLAELHGRGVNLALME